MFEDFEFEEKYNPWDVQSLEEFHFYCCPVCPFKNVNKTDFINHAISAHPESQSSIEFFNGNKENIKTIRVKTENAQSTENGTKNTNITERESSTDDKIPKNHPILSKKPVVSLPKLSDSIIGKYLKPNLHTSLSSNVSSVHENDRFSCHKCDKSFSLKSTLNRHIQSVHNNVQYNCDKCDKSFTSCRIRTRNLSHMSLSLYH